MQYSNTIFQLLTRINITDGVSSTFTISNETETNTANDTGGEKVSLVLSNNRQRERFIVTIENNVCTIVSRGLSRQGGGASTALQREWGEGTLGYLTALDFDIFEKDSETKQVVSADTQFTGAVETDEVTSATTSDFRIRYDGGDMKFRDNNQSEISLSELASASGSDEKIKISSNDTTAGYLNGKLVAGDGISFTENNDGLNETLDVDVDITDTTVFSSTSSANKVPITNSNGDLSDFVKPSLYGSITETADDDTFSVWDTSAGEFKEIEVSDLKTDLGVTHTGTLQTQGGSSTSTTFWTFTPTNSVVAYIELNASNKNTYNETYFEEYNGSTYDVIASVVIVSNETTTKNFVVFLKGGTQYRLRRYVDEGRSGYAYAKYVA